MQYILFLVHFMRVSHIVNKKFDYTEWLGPGYKESQKLPAKIGSIIVAPHICWMDTIVIGGVFRPAFCVKADGAKVPVLFGILLGMQAFYIDRTSGDLAVEQIKEKQKAIEEDPRHPPILVFPEGTQSNGKQLLPFKRGVFESLRAVIPIVPNFKGNETMGPTWECLGFIEQITLICSWGVYSCDIQELPPFKPNEFMYQKYADKGKSQAEIYAWVVQDVVSKVSGLPKAD